jgi:hypothetical protein
MRLLCEFHGTQYIACGEILIAVNHLVAKELQQFAFPSGKGSQIIAITVSNDGKYVYAGYANKFICCWDTLTREVLGSVLHSKRPTSLVYNEVLAPVDGIDVSKSVLIVSDKAGLIYGMDVPCFNKQVLLAGHTASVITDMATSGKYVATADRDEKVRISNFPRMDTIQSFCMAHTNVVTSISFVTCQNETLMISCGWDHLLCLWNYIDGLTYDILQYEASSPDGIVSTDGLNDTASSVVAEVPNSTGKDSADLKSDSIGDPIDRQADTAEDIVEVDKTYDEDSAGHYPVKVVTAPNSSLVAVIFKNQTYLKIYHIEKTATGYSLGKETLKELEAVPCDICFTSTNELVVLLPKPFYMQIIALQSLVDKNEGSSLSVKEFNDSMSVIPTFQKFCSDQGFDFLQQLVSTEDGVDADKGT